MCLFIERKESIYNVRTISDDYYDADGDADGDVDDAGDVDAGGGEGMRGTRD